MIELRDHLFNIVQLRDDSTNATSTSTTPHYWKYTPSIPAAAIFAVLYTVTTLWHMVQAGKMRTYYFIPLIVGGICEVVGYIDRILGHNNETSQAIFIVQTVCLLVAPTLFCASIYMVLGRIMVFTQGEKLSPIRTTWLTKIFVVGDIFTFFVQAAGAAMSTSTTNASTGKNIILAGLYLQLGFFSLFLLTGMTFHWRLAHSPTTPSLQNNWTKYMYALYGAGALILARSVYRVFEFEGGQDGTIQTNEWYLYVFDTVPMFVVMGIFNAVHPGQIIGRARKEVGYGLEQGGSFVPLNTK